MATCAQSSPGRRRRCDRPRDGDGAVGQRRRSRAQPGQGCRRDRHRQATGRGRHVAAPGAQHGGLGSGLLGDFVGDVAHHGGDAQAVYAFAREELDWWGRRLGRVLPGGLFGENLTTIGLDVDAAMVGDRWSVGDPEADGVLLEVTGPRIPCATFALRMGEPGWLRTFTEVARSGAYLRILTAGTVRPGDPIRQVFRASHGIELPVVYRAWMGDLAAARVVLDAGCLPEDELQLLRDRMARRDR